MRLSLFFSIDSFVGAFFMVAISRRRLSYAAIVGAFALCDALAGALGTMWAAGHSAPTWIHAHTLPVGLSVSVTLLMLAAKRDDRSLWFLPALLSLDNLLGGLNGAFHSVAAPWISGVTSAAFAALGMLAGRVLKERSPRMQRAIAVCAPFFMWLIPIL